MSRKRTRKKEFECGHKALGTYCHKCYDSNKGMFYRKNSRENSVRFVTSRDGKTIKGIPF